MARNDTDMDAHLRHTLKNVKIKEVSLVDQGANQHAHVILTKSLGVNQSGSDEPGTDMRSASERSATMFAMVKTLIATPPVASERFDDYVRRALGAGYPEQLTSDELAAARKVFASFSDGHALRHAADAALKEVAAEVRKRAPKLSEAQAFTKAAASNPDLYAALRGKYDGAFADGLDDGADDDDDSQDELQKRADAIEKAEGCTPAQAYLRAAQRNATLYAKTRARVR